MAVSKVPASSPSPQPSERSCGPMASLVDSMIARASVPVSNTPPEDARIRRAAAINATLRKYLTDIPIEKAKEKERVRQPREPLHKVVRREAKFIPPNKEPKYWVETLDCGHFYTSFPVFSKDFDGHISKRAPIARARSCRECGEAKQCQNKEQRQKRAKKKKR
jgi:hypothetical protein